MNWYSIIIRRAHECLQALMLFAWLLPNIQAFANNPTITTSGYLANNPPPGWSINPDDFEFNMNAVIRLSFTGLPSNVSGNIIGAFVGNELRGVATPVLIGTDVYYFLTIYSNEYTGETVHFKAYYQPNDVVYGTFEEVVFIHNLSIGNAGSPFWIDIDPNADFPPELTPIIADTTLQTIPFDPIVLTDYLFSADGDPVIWSAQPGPNLSVTLVNGILTVSPNSNSWIGTDSVRIIVTENTANQLADTITAWFTVLADYGPPLWQTIPDQTIFPGQQFAPFDLDDYLTFGGDCHQFDFDVFPFTGSAADPAWLPVPPGAQPMTVIARPLFGDVPLAGAGAKLAAFVNGNLAGWATPTGISPNISYTILIKNVGAGAITFRFYDAVRQYLYEENTNLAFVAGGSVGAVGSPYLIQLSPLVPSMAPIGQMTVAIDDPTWTGSFPIDFIVWDCDYPNLRRDTFQAVFSIISDIRPEINSATAVNFEENACSTLYDTQTSDPNNSEGNGLSYALAGGADASKFSIDAQTGILSWAAGFSPDFEAPADANTDNQYQVNIKVTNASNLSDTLGLTVTITNQSIEPFTAKINGGNSLLCTNGTANLQASGGVSYLWNTGFTLADITVSSPGTYSVTVTSTGACTATASIVVAPQPSITASGSPIPVCIGTNINLKSTPSGGSTPYASFAWAGPNGYSNSVEDPAGFSATPVAAGTYTVTLTDAAGCTATASTTITVSGSSAPTIAAGSNSPVCDGASLSLNATPSGGSGSGYTFLWSGPNNFGATAQNPAPFNATLAAAGNYQVVVTDGAGCTGTGTTSVQVNTKPSITASSNSPVSVGGTILLSSSVSGGSGNGYTYLWSGPNNYASTAAQPVGFTASLAAVGVYTVTVTDSNGCTGTGSTTVTVVACPTITAAVSGAVCEGGMVTLQSTPAGGALPYASFSWSGPNGYSAIVEDPAGFQANMSANGTYTVTVTDQLGCSATANTTVVVNPNPSITAQNNGPHCAGATAIVSSAPAGGTPGYSFLWTGPDFFGANSEDPAPFTATVPANGIYQVKVTDSKGCTATATTDLVVNAKPTISASNNGPLCIDATLDLNANPAGGSGVFTFVWSGPASFSSTLEDPKRAMIQLIHAGAYLVTVTDNTGCSATASTTLSISSNNAPSITASSNSPLCAGSQLTLTSNATLGTSPYTAFAWSGPNSYTSTMEDPTPFVVLLNGAGVYNVTVTDTKNCKGTASVTVNIFAPSLNPSTNSPVCPGATLQLNAGGPTGAGITYSWTGPNNFTSAQSDPSIPNATPAASGAYFVTVNDNGCIGTSAVTASVSDVTPPTITCPANTTLAADANCSSQVGAYTATSVSDNCNPNPVVTQSPVATTVISGHNFAQTITLTANDGNGNTASCTFTVTLKDVTPPSITCPANTTVAADANCSGVVGSYAAVTLSDNCAANPTLTQSPASSTLLLGHNDVETVTLNANDGNGNTANCTFTVTLKDVTPPSITCPANMTVAADANCSGVVGAHSAVSTSDNCNANPTVTQNPAPSTVLSGHNDVKTVTLTANDGNGNTAFCTFTVTLKDITKPMISCPANMTVAADANCSGIVGTHAPLAVSDNCTANPTVTQTPAPSTVLMGHNDVETVTLTADDGNGNTQFCTFTVTLKDFTPPSITCPANMTVAADANCSGVVGAHSPVSVSDNCNANPTVTQSPAPSTVLSGHNDVETVTLTANDGNGNTAFCTFTVTLNDVTPPTITCPANMTIAADANCSGIVGSYSAVTLGDNCNPNPVVTQSPPSSTVLMGHNDVETVTLTANDGNGNTAFCTLTVTLKDVTQPSITCPANTTVAADANCSSPVGAYSAVSVSDNCTTIPMVAQSPAPITLLTGHNDLETVTLTADDGNGNMQFCTFTVTLKDITPPTVVCKPFTAALNAAGMVSITTANVFQSGADNCGTVNQVSVIPNQFTCANLGPNTVTLTVNDGNGNSATCTAIVTVVDLIPPTMLCKNVTKALDANGMASVTAAEINNGSFDNCTLFSLSLAPGSFTCANLGANTVTLTGSDQSGNTATCQSIVTIIDNIPPTMLCQNATLNLNNTGQATLTVAGVNNGSFDNCSIVQFSLSQTLFTCANLGDNTVKLTGIDQSGNASFCFATVTVRDLIPPVAKCKNATVNLGPNGTVTVPNSAIDNGTTDNCSFTISLSPNTFTCANIGLNTLTLKATDGSGNSNTCTARVTVKDVTAPTVSCKNITIFLDDLGKVTISPFQVDNGSTDNCSITTRSLTRTQFNCSDIGAPVNVFLTAIDASGNAATCTAVITVKDNLAPTPVCNNVTVALESNGTVTVYPSILADSSFDNCSVWAFVPVAKTYTAANLGPNNLLITVKDWSGNAATCTSVVTVLANGPEQRPGDPAPPPMESTDRSGLRMVVYPNPAAGDALLHFELSSEQTFMLRVYNRSGLLIFSQKAMGAKGENSVQLRREMFLPGLYFIHLQTDGKDAQKRLMIQD